MINTRVVDQAYAVSMIVAVLAIAALLIVTWYRAWRRTREHERALQAAEEELRLELSRLAATHYSPDARRGNGGLGRRRP